MSVGRNVRWMKCPGTKCPGTKCPLDEMFGDEMSVGRNVRWTKCPLDEMYGDEVSGDEVSGDEVSGDCLLYTSPSPRDKRQSRMPSSA